MVKMENISLEGSIATMDCYEEGDKNRAHHVVFDINTWEILDGDRENLYVGHAIAKIGRLFEENHELPRTTSSYWY